MIVSSRGFSCWHSHLNRSNYINEVDCFNNYRTSSCFLAVTDAIFNCTLACPLLSSSLTLPTQLYKHGRYYPFYQIIIPGWYDADDWGKMEDGEFNFTSE